MLPDDPEELFDGDAVGLDCGGREQERLAICCDRTLNGEVDGYKFLEGAGEGGAVGGVLDFKVFNFAIGGTELLREDVGEAFAADEDVGVVDNGELLEARGRSGTAWNKGCDEVVELKGDAGSGAVESAIDADFGG